MTTQILDFEFSEEREKRIDLFLKEKIPNLSRSEIQNLIETNKVKVNNIYTKKSYRLKKGDKISVLLKEKNNLLSPKKEIKVEVIYQDKNFVVVNKPAGLVVHPGGGVKHSNTLVNWLLYHFPNIKNVGEDINRPGIVHRLDKYTSGVMVAALNNEAFYFLKRQFQEKKVKKEYLALCSGVLKEDEYFILKDIVKKGAKQLIAYKSSEKKKSAETLIKVKRRYKNFTLVCAYPKTGRMHQIRIHLKYLNAPILGDRTYGKRKEKNFTFPRYFLHAKSLEFAFFDGKKRKFSAPISKDFQEVLKYLDKNENATLNDLYDFVKLLKF